VLGEACQTLFGSFCHQDPSILMVVDGRLLELCPRCVGLHFGFITAFITATLSFRRGLVLSRTGSRVLLVLAVASLAFDWSVGGRLGLYAPGVHSRLLTGLACGSALAVLMTAYRSSLWSISVGAARGARARDVGAVMLLSIAGGVLLVGAAGWTALTALCAVSVVTNVAIVLGTTARMLRVRLRLGRCAGMRDAAYSEGGGG
jgi:uncharacterized membrane protein